MTSCNESQRCLQEHLTLVLISCLQTQTWICSRALPKHSVGNISEIFCKKNTIARQTSNCLCVWWGEQKKNADDLLVCFLVYEKHLDVKPRYGFSKLCVLVTAADLLDLPDQWRGGRPPTTRAGGKGDVSSKKNKLSRHRQG